jgi:hypothetical protein
MACWRRRRSASRSRRGTAPQAVPACLDYQPHCRRDSKFLSLIVMGHMIGHAGTGIPILSPR